MTLEEMILALEALKQKSAVQAEAVKAEEGADERKLKLAELKTSLDEIEALEVEVEEKRAEDAMFGQIEGFDKPGRSRTLEAGALDASRITTHENVYDDPNLGFKNFGDCAQSVYKAASGTGYDPRLRVIESGNPELQAAGLRQGSGPEGGFLVPSGFRSADLTNEQGMSLDLYGETRNFSLGQEESITIPAINETSRKDGSMYGGVTANWLEEEGTLEESEPSFRQVMLKPKEIAVFIKVSDKLLRNSPIALGQFLSFASQDVMTFKLADAVLNGNGSGKPKGILQSDALVVIAKEGSQSADTVKVENTVKMKAKLTRRWASGAKWYINKDVMPQIELFTIGDRPVFVPAGAVAGQPFATLHGFPIQETEYSEVLGDQGDILLANLRAYVTAQHGGGMRSDTSIHFEFNKAKTAFRFMMEADGQTWLQNPITDFKGSGTTSPFITLAERA